MNEATTTVIADKPLVLRFPVREQVIFFKRLAMLLRAGMPLREGLLMVERERNSRSAAYIFSCLLSDVSHGKSLSTSLSRFSGLFGTLSISMIRVGESSGALHQSLLHVSEELKKKDALAKKMLGALLYPAVIVVATIMISTVLTVYIFPKIMPIFQGFKRELPITTRILIALSNFLVRDGWWVLLSLGIGAIACLALFRTPRARRSFDSLVLWIPIFGRLARAHAIATVTRTMSLLLGGDVRIVQALVIVADSTGNGEYRDRILDVGKAVARGQKLSAELSRYPRLFPPLCTQMIAVAEASGDLAGSFMYISDMYEEEISDLTKNLATLLEPILMLVMGVIVGFIAVSIITPIYSITQNLTPH